MKISLCIASALAASLHKKMPGRNTRAYRTFDTFKVDRKFPATYNPEIDKSAIDQAIQKEETAKFNESLYAAQRNQDNSRN